MTEAMCCPTKEFQYLRSEFGAEYTRDEREARNIQAATMKNSLSEEIRCFKFGDRSAKKRATVIKQEFSIPEGKLGDKSILFHQRQCAHQNCAQEKCGVDNLIGTVFCIEEMIASERIVVKVYDLYQGEIALSLNFEIKE